MRGWQQPHRHPLYAAAPDVPVTRDVSGVSADSCDRPSMNTAPRFSHPFVARTSRRRALLALLSLPFCAAAAAPSAASTDKAAQKAARRKAREDALDALRRGEILPLVRILDIASRHLPGDTIEVEFKGGPVYEVKVLTADGSIREIVLDARTGALVRIKDP